MNEENIKKGVSALDFFCIGFGSIVGVGWAVSINKWMESCAGPVPAALGFIVALVVMVPIALCYCELVPMLPVAGGEMAFSYKAFGEKISIISGWAAFGAFVSIVPWEAIQITDVLCYLVPNLKSGDPLYTLAGTDIYPMSVVIGAVFSVVIFLVNRKGLSSAAKLQKFLCVFLVAAALIGAVCAIIGGSFSNLAPLYDNTVKEGLNHNSFMGGVLAMMVSVPFFVTGFETIPQGVESAGGDIKKVGKTVVLSVVLACVFYAVLLICFGAGVPWAQFISLNNPAASNLFTILFPGAFGKFMFWLITLGAIAGLFTTWNGFFMASSNLLMALSRGRLMPPVFAVQKENGVPINGLKFALILSLAGPFAGAGLIGDLTSFSSSVIMLSWTITAFSLIRLRKTMPDANRPYKIAGGLKTAWFAAIIASVVLVLLFVPGSPMYMGGISIKMFFAWMILGLVLFAMCAPQRNKVSKEEREKTIFARLEK